MATSAAKFDFVPDESAPAPKFDFAPDNAAPAFDFVPDATLQQEGQKASLGALQAIDVMAATQGIDPTKPGHRFDWSDVNEKLDQDRFYKSESLRAQAALNPQQAPELLAQSEQVKSGITPFTSTGRKILQNRIAANEGLREQMETDGKNFSTRTQLGRAIFGNVAAAQMEPMVEAAAQQSGAAIGGALGAASFVHPGFAAARLAVPMIAGFMGSQMGGAVQEKALQLTETPEETSARQERWSDVQRANPGSFLVGSMASQAPFFKPSIDQIGRALRGERAAIVNLGAAGGIGAGTEAIMQRLQGREFDPQSIIGSGIANMLMSEPTALGRRMGFPTSPAEVADMVTTREPGRTSIAEVIPPAPDRTSITEVFGKPTETPSVPIRSSEQPITAPETTTPAVEAPVSETPATTAQDIVPAIRVGDQVIKGEKGDTHKDILNRHMEANPDDVESLVNFDTKENPNVFVDPAGNTLSREQLKDQFGVSDSQGLAKLQAETPPPVVEPPVAEAPKEAPVEPAKDIVDQERQSLQEQDPNATSNKEAVVNKERAERALDPVIKEAAIENTAAIEHAENTIAQNPAAVEQIVQRLRADPMNRSISLEDGAVMLVGRVKLQNTRDEALNRATDESLDAMSRGIAHEEFKLAESALNEMDQAAQDARSTWGRFGQLWQRSMKSDFTLANLERRARLQKGGPLTETESAQVKKVADDVQAAQENVTKTQEGVATSAANKAIDETISATESTVEPAIKSIADRIIARLDLSAKNAATSLRSRLQNLGSAPDPLIVLDVAKIAAAKTAKGAIKFAQWSAEMIQEFGEKIRPFLQAGWDQREQHIDTMVAANAGKKTREVKSRINKEDTTGQQERIVGAIGNRIKEGKPLSELGSYVKRLAENFVKSGVNDREALIDRVHGELQSHDPKITRSETMELMSGFGKSTPLSKEPTKVTLRDINGQIQQILKLEKIAAGEPIPKTGPERRTPSVIERTLIKAVNAAKKKFGVKVTDPETQLKSTLDGVRTRLRNEIEDMSLEIETGQRPPEKTPVEYTQDIEVLKGVRDRLRQTLQDIDGPTQVSDEQRIASAKRALEASISSYENRLAGQSVPKGKKTPASAVLDALRAKRDALKGQLDEVNAVDAVLQEEKKAQSLVRSIEATERQLVGNTTKAKVSGADTQLVADAKAQLANLREQLSAKRDADPSKQREAIDKAEAALEKSIASLDADLESGKLTPKAKRTTLESDRLSYLRAQRDAMNKLRTQLRNEAKPRLAPLEAAIKARKSYMLKKAEELTQRAAAEDFAPRTRKKPVDLSSDPTALDAQAKLEEAKGKFAKLQEEWRIKNLTGTEKVLRGIKQGWEATRNAFLAFDLSAPLQTAFAMAAHPVEGVKAIYKGGRAAVEQFTLNSDKFAKREEQRLVNSPNYKNGIYKQMGLEMSVSGAHEENAGSVLERLADLESRWAGVPDVIKGLYGLNGKQLVKGAAQMARFVPKIYGMGIKASNVGFNTIANHMRARTADAILNRMAKSGRVPTKAQLELIGNQVNAATGKGGFKGEEGLRRLLFAPNYYLSIIKQMTAQPLLKALVKHEGHAARQILQEYVQAALTMGSIVGLQQLFGNRNKQTYDPRSKDFAQAQTDRGTKIDFTMGRGKYASLATQLVSGQQINKKGQLESNKDRMEILLQFIKGRLSREISTALTTGAGRDFRNKPISKAKIAQDLVTPLSWRDVDDVLKREGLTRGSFIQLLNILGVTNRLAE